MEKDDSFWKSRLGEPLNAWPVENSKSFNAEKKRLSSHKIANVMENFRERAGSFQENIESVK